MRRWDGVILTPLPTLSEQASGEILLFLIIDVSHLGAQNFPRCHFYFRTFSNRSDPSVLTCLCSSRLWEPLFLCVLASTEEWWMSFISQWLRTLSLKFSTWKQETTGLFSILLIIICRLISAPVVVLVPTEVALHYTNSNSGQALRMSVWQVFQAVDIEAWRATGHMSLLCSTPSPVFLFCFRAQHPSSIGITLVIVWVSRSGPWLC